MLVLDDERYLLSAMEDFFNAYGCDVDCTSEREEAEALLSKNSYDVVVTDLFLTPEHETDGLTLIRLIKHHYPQTLAVLFTAYGCSEVEQAATDAGADAVLHKPMPLPALAGTLHKLLERRSCA